MAKELIEFSDFLEVEKKLEIKMGLVVTAEYIIEGKKFLLLKVTFGGFEDIRPVVTNLGDKFRPEEFVGKTFPFITNLKPTVIAKTQSEAMIMVGTKRDESLTLDLIHGVNIL